MTCAPSARASQVSAPARATAAAPSRWRHGGRRARRLASRRGSSGCEHAGEAVHDRAAMAADVGGHSRRAARRPFGERQPSPRRARRCRRPKPGGTRRAAGRGSRGQQRRRVRASWASIHSCSSPANGPTPTMRSRTSGTVRRDAVRWHGPSQHNVVGMLRDPIGREDCSGYCGGAAAWDCCRGGDGRGDYPLHVRADWHQIR